LSADLGRTAVPAAQTAGFGLLAALTLLNVLNFADRYLLVAFSHSIIADLQLSKLQFGLLTGFWFTVFYTLYGMFAGGLADRYHRPRVIALGLLLWSALTALTGLARSFAVLAGLRAFIGMSEAMLTPAAASMLADRLPERRRSLGLGIYYLGIPVGVGASFIFAGTLGTALGWRNTFLVLGAIGLPAAVAVALWMRDPPRGGGASGAPPQDAHAGSVGESIRGVIDAVRKSPAFALTLTGSALAVYLQGVAVFDLVWWVQERGYEEAFAQRVTGLLFLVGGILGTLAGGWGADWAERKRPGGRLLFLAGCYLAIVPLTIAYRLVPSHTALFYALALITTGSMMISFGATFAAVQDMVAVKLRGAAVALLILCNNLLGQALGAGVVGALADLFTSRGIAQPLTWAFVVAAIPGFLAIPAFYFAARLQKPRH
jgi:MFS transporter, Spinster family, sphingosine-1-phosphate transporter